MATSRRDVQVDILGTDKTEKATKGATKGFERLDRQLEKSSKAMSKNDGAASKAAGAFLAVTRSVGKMVAGLAAGGAALGSTALGLLAVAKYAAAAAKAAAGLGPLAAFLPSIAASAGLVIGTLKLAGPGLARAFEPVTRAFFDAEGNATKLTKRIQDLAAKGIQPLARDFVKINLPSIAAAMDHIAIATNRVVANTLKWTNSTEGQRTIWMLTTSTAAAFDRLSVKVDAAVIALLRLTGRAGNEGISGLETAIGRLLDKFTAWANSTSAEDIGQALDDLSGYAARLRTAWESIRGFGNWLGENEGKVRSFTTALSVIGIVVGIATGTWIPAIIGGLVLLATNFDKISGPAGRMAEKVTGAFRSIRDDPAVQSLMGTLAEHFERMRPILETFAANFTEKIMPKLIELKNVILTQVVPAIDSLLQVVLPVVELFAQKLAPAVTTAFGVILDVIQGALKIISGIINVFVGLVTGDWDKLWQGLGQIVSGFGQIVISSLQGTFRTLGTVVALAWDILSNAFTGLRNNIIGFFVTSGSWLANVGRMIVQGLADGITGAWGKVSASVQGLIARAKEAIPAPLRGALGFAGGSGGWRPARMAAGLAAAGALAFAGAGDGGHRTGGPTPVSVTNVVTLDGQPFYAMTSTVVDQSQRRADWRGKVGTR